jgi:hypothetical protein
VICFSRTHKPSSPGARFRAIRVTHFSAGWGKKNWVVRTSRAMTVLLVNKFHPVEVARLSQKDAAHRKQCSRRYLDGLFSQAMTAKWGAGTVEATRMPA